MPTHHDITCAVRSVDKMRPDTSPEVQTTYFYQLLVSSSVIKHTDPFVTLSPNLKNLPLQYLAIQILRYSNHQSYFNHCNTTNNHPSTSLYKLHDQKMIGIWESSIHASISGRENFKLFGIRLQKESIIIIVTRKNYLCNQIGTSRHEIFILQLIHDGSHH